MGILQDKVKNVINVQKKKKWQILDECCSDDIKDMLAAEVPLRKQLEIILSAGVLDKLTLNEYYKILKNHFGYIGRQKKAKVFELKNEDVNLSTDNKRLKGSAKSISQSQTQRRIDVKKELSKDINLLKTAGIDIDAALDVMNND